MSLIDPDSLSHRSVEERLAVLEERTRPKAHSTLDRLKEWGGVASLAIALAYSFPLGLWDRFIVPEQERQQAELDSLRAIIAESSRIVVEGVAALGGTTDPMLYDAASRSTNTRLYVLVVSNIESFRKHKEDLSASEALVVAYNLLGANQHAAAMEFLEEAQRTAEDDVVTRVEAIRLRGRALFTPGPHQDRKAARAVYSSVMSLREHQSSPQVLGTVATALADWGLLELADGDWACGQTALGHARELYATNAPFLNDQGNFIRVMEGRAGQLTRRPGQPAAGC